MIIIHPEYSTRNKETYNLIFAIVEYKGSPILVFSLSWVSIFIARSAIKFCKTIRVSWEMSRNPVHNNIKSCLMAFIYKRHKIERCAISCSRSKISCNLISPRSIERIFCQRHKFNMCIAHILNIRNKLVRKLCIRESISVRILSP